MRHGTGKFREPADRNVYATKKKKSACGEWCAGGWGAGFLELPANSVNGRAVVMSAIADMHKVAGRNIPWSRIYIHRCRFYVDRLSVNERLGWRRGVDHRRRSHIDRRRLHHRCRWIVINGRWFKAPRQDRAGHNARENLPCSSPLAISCRDLWRAGGQDCESRKSENYFFHKFLIFFRVVLWTWRTMFYSQAESAGKCYHVS
jgi:hypothetical protein